MARGDVKTIKQYRTCPLRIGCNPGRDIQGFRRELHERLRRTCRSELDSLPRATLRIMACHYSKTGEEIACAGWLDNQLGSGNNITVRLAVRDGRLPVPETSGPQHGRFEDTFDESSEFVALFDFLNQVAFDGLLSGIELQIIQPEDNCEHLGFFQEGRNIIALDISQPNAATSWLMSAAMHISTPSVCRITPASIMAIIPNALIRNSTL